MLMLFIGVSFVSVFKYSQKVVQRGTSKKASFIVQSVVFSEQIINKLVKAQ